MFKYITEWLKSRKIKNSSIYDVFTPTKPAKITFIERAEVNNELNNAIATPGKQVVVYGHTGSGKSTLLLNKLSEYFPNVIISRCVENTTFEELIYDCYDQMNSYNIGTFSTIRGKKISAGVEVNPIVGKGKFGGEISEANSQNFQRTIDVQLTPRRLASSLSGSNTCWVVEDFHKVNAAEKKKLADVMKLFTDEEAKIIAIGAVGTAREVVEYNTEMTNRISEILVPLMSDEELMSIILKGESFLNVSIDEKVKESVIKFSSGLAAVCHQLCLNLCRQKSILKRSSTKIAIGENDFILAVNSYVKDNSDTLKSKFDKAVKSDDTNEGDLYEKILKCVLAISKDEVTTVEIQEKLLSKYRDNIVLDQIKEYLHDLESSERGGVIRYDDNSNKFSISDPFFTAYSYCLLKDEVVEDIKNVNPIGSLPEKIQINYSNRINNISCKEYIKLYSDTSIKIDAQSLIERIVNNWDKYEDRVKEMGMDKKSFIEFLEKNYMYRE